MASVFSRWTSGVARCRFSSLAAHVAELADACVSEAHGVTRGGSSPLVSIFAMQNPAKVRGIFDTIATRYDLANHLLSGGLDFLWRRRAAQIVTMWKPALILDLAAGSGDLSLALQKALPEARVVSADFCLPMLRVGVQKGLRFPVVADAMQLPFDEGTFDVVTVAFGLRNMASWPGALQEMARVLRPGGHLLVLDFSMPPAPFVTLYRFYLHRLLPRVAGWITGQRAGYEYLGESIESFPSGQGMRTLMERHGFRATHARPLAWGIVSIYTAAK